MKKLFLIFALLLVSVNLFGAYDLDVVNSERNETVLNFSLDNYKLGEMVINGENCNYVSLTDAAYPAEKGVPGLPYIAKSIIIPNNADMVVEISKVNYKEINVEKIVPSKGTIYRNQNPEEIPYEFGEVYSKDEFYPNNVASLGNPYILRDYRGIVVYVNPFSYNPVKGILRVVESVEVTVKTNGYSNDNILNKNITSISGSFDHIYSTHFLNYDNVKYDQVSDEGNMLVITTDEFASDVASFIEWKNRKGIKTDLAIYPTDTGSSPAAIKTYIQNLYDSEEGLTYILIVGDAEDVPPAVGTAGNVVGNEADPVYVNLAGNDDYPDALIGRFSVTNSTEAQTVINKNLAYEMTPDASGAWYHKAAGIAGDDVGGTPSYSDWARMDFLKEKMLAYNYTEFTEIYHNSASVSQVANAVNEGRGWVNYIGHGSDNSWVTTGFSNSDVSQLSNDGMTPVIISVACVNGNFGGQTCFAEAWQRQGTPDTAQGSVMFGGSSTNQSWVPPCVGQDEMINHLVEDTYFTAGGIFFNGVMAAIDEYPSGDGPELYQSWHLFGDPSLFVYSDTPSELNVTYNDMLPLGSTSFDVNVADAKTNIEKALVSLYMNGNLYGSAYTDENGDATVTFPALEDVGNMEVIVTAYNKMPYFGTTQALVPVQVTVNPMSIPVNTATTVTVTVKDSEGVTPEVGVDVWAEGFGYESAHGTTNASGVATLSVNYAYGPTVKVIGKRPADSYNLFTEELDMTGTSTLASADLTVSTEFGLSNAFAVNLEGTLESSSTTSGYTLYYSVNGADYVAAAGTSVDLTPTASGKVNAIMAKSGYNLYSEEFEIIVAYGQVAGTVTSPDKGAEAGVVVGMYDGEDLIKEVTTAADGSYDFGQDFAVDTYTLKAKKFGFNLYTEEYFVGYGANTKDIALAPSTTYTVSGTVSFESTGVSGTSIKVYRDDESGEMYTETTTDGTGFYSVELPSYSYNIKVKASGYKMITESVDVTADMTKDFELEEADGVLIYDATAAKGRNGEKVSKGLDPALYSTIWNTFGAETTVSASTPADEWFNYEAVAVIREQGSELPAALSADIVSFINEGGVFFISGGEFGYGGMQDDLAAALHISDEGGDPSNTTGLIVANASHMLTTVPNMLSETIAYSYPSYYHGDTITPLNTEDMALSWVASTTKSSLMGFDNQIVYASFNLSSVTNEEDQAAIAQNIGVYLGILPTDLAPVSGTVSTTAGDPIEGVTVEIGSKSAVTAADGTYTVMSYTGEFTAVAYKEGYYPYEVTQEVVIPQAGLTDVDFTLDVVETCTVSGTVTLEGETDHSGATVEVVGTDISTTTAANGTYTLTGIMPGDVVVKASKDGYAQSSEQICLGNGGTQTVNFTLNVYLGWFNDFENENGGFVATAGFAWGSDDTYGAHSGSKVWGTVLNGQYANDANYEMTTPDFNIGAEATLKFWHIYNIEGSKEANDKTFYDGGNVKISVDGGKVWTLITPEGGYPASSVTALGEAGFSGVTMTEWTEVVFDLSNYVGQSAMFKFTFKSDGSIAKNGWYIDDFEVNPTDVHVPPTNLTATTNLEDSIELNWDDMSDVTYNVYRGTESGVYDATAIATGLTTSAYTDSDVTVDTYYYYVVTAVYGDDVESVNSNEAMGRAGLTPEGPSYLNASDDQVGKVVLDWENMMSGSGEGEEIYYDGDNSSAIGTGAATTFDVAARFTSTELTSHYGKNLTTVKIHVASLTDDDLEPTGEASCTSVTVKVWEGGSASGPGALVYQNDITGTDLIYDTWSVHTLTTPVALTTGNEYWIGYSVNTVDGAYPAGCDAGPVVSGKGAWIYFNGAWSELIDLAPTLDCNWNIRGIVESPAKDAVSVNKAIAEVHTVVVSSGELSAISTMSKDGEEPQVVGYNVYRSLTSGSGYTNIVSNLTVNSYEDTDVTAGTDYYYVVTAVFEGGMESSNSPEAMGSALPVNDLVLYDDFEGYTGGSQDLGDWVMIDEDGGQIYGVNAATDYELWAADPETELHPTMAFGIVNVVDAGLVGTAWDPVSGEQLTTSIAAIPTSIVNGTITSDWLISPRFSVVSGDTPAAMSFCAKTTTTEYGPENIEVLVSTNAGTSISDFTDVVVSQFAVTADWEEYMIDLSAYENQGTIRVAIHHTCNDAFTLLIDDVKKSDNIVGIGSEVPASFAVKGNYPNPFNPNTTINYSTEVTGRTLIEVI